MTLRERVTIVSGDFHLSGVGTVYSSGDPAPRVVERRVVPEPTKCVLSRMLSRRYWLIRVDATANGPGPRWSLATPAKVALVELRGETLCFSMRHLAFFEAGLSLKTIANTQLEWIASSRPFIPCITGHGLVGFRINGEPEVLAAAGEPGAGGVPFEQLVAWSNDTVFGVDCSPDYEDSLNDSSSMITPRSTNLIIASRDPVPATGLRRMAYKVWSKIGV